MLLWPSAWFSLELVQGLVQGLGAVLARARDLQEVSKVSLGFG